MYSIKDCIKKRHRKFLNEQGTNKGYYHKKVLNTQSANLIAYWPLWESTGTVINDISGNARNGTYINVSLGQEGVGDHNTCPFFDGSTSRGDLYSPSLRDAWNGQEFSVQIWCAVADAAVWTTNALFSTCLFGANATTNYVLLEKNQASGLHQPIAIAATGGTLLYRTGTSITTLDFMHWCMTYSLSNDRIRFYLNGTKVNTDATGLVAWSGALASTRCVLGSQISTSTASGWKGRLAHLALWTKELTPAEVLNLSSSNP